MKLKPNQTRTYDGEGFKKRAACLCFKNEREEEVREQRSHFTSVQASRTIYGSCIRLRGLVSFNQKCR